MSPTSNALRDATIDSNAVNEQAKAWAASRSNFGLNCDQNMDPKKMRQFMLRSLANKRSRLRKQMYLAKLEIKVKKTQVQIDDDLRPKIESKLYQKGLLLLERETIIHEISTLEKELLLKATLTKELLAELNVWNELYTMSSNNQVPPISFDIFPNYCSNSFDQALTEELMIGLNVSNEQHTMQQEQISYDQDIEPNENQMWGATIANEHEANVVDLSNAIGLMEMISTPTFNNQFL
ncbi:hypothetical protein P8452_25002 [Trifolium repens]|nr:hypothetical protein P8452_25002 [Trifolium repens]